MYQAMIDRIAFLERREAELVREEASLLTTGSHRRAWREALRALTVVREELAAERASLAAARQLERDLGLDQCSPEERAYYDEMCRQYEAWDRMETEARERRSQFRLIPGGKR